MHAHYQKAFWSTAISSTQAMKHFRSLGLLHSDLKGANVMLESAVPSPDEPQGLTCNVRYYLAIILVCQPCESAGRRGVPEMCHACEGQSDDLCLLVQIADFGMSRVLADDKTHVSTDTHGGDPAIVLPAHLLSLPACMPHSYCRRQS